MIKISTISTRPGQNSGIYIYITFGYIYTYICNIWLVERLLGCIFNLNGCRFYINNMFIIFLYATNFVIGKSW